MLIYALVRRVVLAMIWCSILALFVADQDLLAQANNGNNSIVVATLSKPHMTVQYTATPPADATHPFFHNGYLIQFRHVVFHTDETNIYLCDSHGLLKHAISIRPTDAAKFVLTAADLGQGREVVFSGEETRFDGSTVGFVGITDTSGSKPRYFSTANYIATLLSIGDDGSIWSVGAERVKTSSLGRMWDNYDVLRHFSSEGVLLGHFVPRWGSATSYVVRHLDSSSSQVGSGPADSSIVDRGIQKKDSADSGTTLLAYDKSGNYLTSYGPPFWGPIGSYAHGYSDSRQAWLRAIGDGVVFYDGMSGILYSYSRSGGALTSRSVDMALSEDRRIYGFAVSSDGRIYASFKRSDLKHEISRKYSRNAGLYELLSPSSGLARWSEVRIDPSVQARLSRHFTVLGFDGDSLVYVSQASQVNWSVVQHLTVDK